MLKSEIKYPELESLKLKMQKIFPKTVFFWIIFLIKFMSIIISTMLENKYMGILGAMT